MKAVWVGGPKDGDVLELPDECEVVRITLEPEIRMLECPVLPFRHANGLRGHAIDFYNMHNKGFLHGTE